MNFRIFSVKGKNPQTNRQRTSTITLPLSVALASILDVPLVTAERNFKRAHDYARAVGGSNPSWRAIYVPQSERIAAFFVDGGNHSTSPAERRREASLRS